MCVYSSPVVWLEKVPFPARMLYQVHVFIELGLLQTKTLLSIWYTPKTSKSHWCVLSFFWGVRPWLLCAFSVPWALPCEIRVITLLHLSELIDEMLVYGVPSSYWVLQTKIIKVVHKIFRLNVSCLFRQLTERSWASNIHILLWMEWKTWPLPSVRILCVSVSMF